MASTLTVDNIVGATTAANVKLPAGAVLQTIQTNSNSAYSSASTSFVDTGRSVTITPKYNTSKILITVSATMSASAANVQPIFTIYRDSTNIGHSNRGFGQSFNGAGSSHMMLGCSYLDSPATTNAITYKIYVRTNQGTLIWGADSGTQCYTAQEISV